MEGMRQEDLRMGVSAHYNEPQYEAQYEPQHPVVNTQRTGAAYHYTPGAAYGAAYQGQGSTGTASVPTYGAGSPWQATARIHPHGHQMGTDVSYFGGYQGTYVNTRGQSNVYTWDPDGVTVYGR